MPSMLDMISPDDQADLKRQGMLSFASGLLGASGWSRTPISMGQALGQGMQNYQQTRAQMIPSMLQGAMLQRQVAGEEDKQRKEANLSAAMDPGKWEQRGEAWYRPGVDLDRVEQAMRILTPATHGAALLQSQKPKDPVKLGTNEVLLDPNNAYQEVARGPEPKPTQHEPPEVIQLAQALRNPNAYPEERAAAQGRIDALTKGSLSPIEQKELFDASDRYQAGSFAMAALNDALSYNNDAYEGMLADATLLTNRNLGRDKKGVTATTNFRSIMTGQVLEALRATFGANPTEGERKILLEVQSSINMSRAERESLIKRAVTLAEQRRASEANRVQNIQGGAYRAGGNALPATAAAPTTQSRPAGTAPQGVSPELWNVMTPEERALWQN